MNSGNNSNIYKNQSGWIHERINKMRRLDLDNLRFADVPRGKISFKDTSVNSFKEIIDEIALHEASHFVFNCMFLKEKLGFSRINYIQICTTNLEKCVVSGFAPNLPSVRMHDIWLKDFYTGDLRRIRAKLISLLAGYMSCKFFLRKDNDFFIGVPKVEEKKIRYFSIETVPLTADVSDFRKASKYLDYINIEQGKKRETLSTIADNVVIELMKVQAIHDSIRYVQRELISNECRPIKDNQLDLLIDEVQRLTNKVRVDEIINSKLLPNGC